jgi:hypothetical protein
VPAEEEAGLIMAAPHSLKPGDTVSHPDWPAGMTRKVTDGGSLGTRGGYNAKGRYQVKHIADERYLRLDEPVDLGDGYADDHWAEAGLELVNPQEI